MEQTFYILKNGTLKKNDNNITVIDEEGNKKDLKIEMMRDIYLFGEVSLNTKVLNFLGQMKIPVHIYNYYGYYTGTFYPKETNVAGEILVKQVKFYDDNEKRLELAKEFIESGAYNISRNLRYYNEREKSVEHELNKIKSLIPHIEKCNSVEELMGVEGNIRKIYYETWEKIFIPGVEFEKRVKRPPDNMVNTLISFINSLVYTACLSEIYKTHMNPVISFLHEPGTKRFSLALDIAEIFKPLISDRLIFALVNTKEISEDDFEEKSNFYHLKDSGKMKILKKFDERMNKTINHRTLKRSVSYRYLMRLECFKLIKHLNGEQKYDGFKIWW